MKRIKIIYAAVPASLIISFLVGILPASAVILATPHFSSIAFIPGIEGSRLFKPVDSGVIKNIQLWEPVNNSDVRDLFLDQNGSSTDPSVYVGGIVDHALLPVAGPKIYQGFSDMMDSYVSSRQISEWKPLAYDWRLDLNQAVDSTRLFDGTIQPMVGEIEAMAANSYTGKVTIVAHSNGGLIAKLLIQKLQAKGEDNLIDRLIMVAVPQLGTPQAAAALLHGSGTGIGILGANIIMTESTGRQFASNMPGTYQLLPSKKYFDSVSDPVIEFDPSIDPISNLRTVYGNAIASSAAFSSFLTAGKDHRAAPDAADLLSPAVANKKLLAKADAIHANLDSYIIPSGIQVTQIAGWGMATVRGIKYVKKTENHCVAAGACNPQTFVDDQPLLVSDGDGTVVSPSATAIAAQDYYFDLHTFNAWQDSLIQAAHANILEALPVLGLIQNIAFGANNPLNFISQAKPAVAAGEKSIRLSGHSPISIDLYDSQGRHTGLIPNPNPDSDFQLFEAKIPNSYYIPFGEGKYAGFDSAASTTVKIQGTGIGTFTLDVEELAGGKVATSSAFEDVPVMPDTEASVSFASSTPILQVDLDGDGKVDLALRPKEEFDPVSYLSSMKNVITGFHLNKAAEKLLLSRIDDMIKKIQKGKIAGVQAKIKSYLRAIQKDRKHHRKISNDDIQTVVDMLNKLLDNLN